MAEEEFDFNKAEEDVENNIFSSGWQEGKYYPRMPVTNNEFQQLLENPDLPPENQSSPSPEKLNPHLFPKR